MFRYPVVDKLDRVEINKRGGGKNRDISTEHVRLHQPGVEVADSINAPVRHRRLNG